MARVEASVPKYHTADKGGGIFLRLDQRPDPRTGNETFAVPPMGSRFGERTITQSDKKIQISAGEWFNALPYLYKEQFLSDRQNLYTILGVKSLIGIQSVIHDPETRVERETHANRTIANQYNLSGSDLYIAERLRGYADLADEVVEEVARTLDKPKLFELTNEVATTRSVLELIGYVFDRKADHRIRFEANRKLTLMEIMASIDQHEREETERQVGMLTMGTTREERERILEIYQLEGTDSNYEQFQEFLDNFVFKSKVSGGEAMGVLESTHDLTNFAAKEVVRLPRKQARIARYRTPRRGHKYTDFGERTFEQDGQHFSVYSTSRKKDKESTALKMVRKATKDPGGIQDKIGNLAVLQDRKAISAFMGRLRQGASEAGIPFEIDESEDTLDGKPYSAQNPGSSKDLRAFKFIARIGDLKVEFLIFDHLSYIDNLYRDDVSHEEFAVKRYYETGAAQFLFPEKIYDDADHAKLEASRRQAIRVKMRG